MHELSVCLSLIKSIEAQAEKHQFKKITTLSLEIGDLAGIDISAIQFHFPIAAKHTIAGNARLDIHSIPGKGICNACQSHIRIKNLMSACPKCYSYDYQITQGKEMQISTMEVE